MTKELAKERNNSISKTSDLADKAPRRPYSIGGKR